MRSFDIALANDILSESDGGDLTALVSDKRNWLVIEGRAAAIFAWRGPDIYEGHTFFGKDCRGSKALDAARAILGHMSHARMIWGLTPIERREVRWFNRKIGFESHGIMMTPEGEHELFVMEF